AFASAVASGDSFVAAFLWEWQHGAKPTDPESAFRLATGAGAANAAVIGAGFCTRESVYDLAARAQVEALGPRLSKRGLGSLRLTVLRTEYTNSGTFL